MLLKRVLAFIADVILLSLVVSLIAFPVRTALTDFQRLPLALATAALYFTFFLWLWNGQTPGSRLLGLKVVRPGHKRLPLRYALLRTAGVEISYLLLGFGFTLSLVRLDRRTLSDLISGTDVLQSASAKT